MDLSNKFKCPDNDILPLGGVLPPVNRIVVIGDVHGDMKQFKNTLKLAKVIDNKDNWIGNDTVVVQLGDLIDSCRGIDCKIPATDDEPNDLNLLKYTVDLHFKAQKHGGAFYSLLGNHEIMNVAGHMSHVSPKNFDIFQDLLNKNNKFSNVYEARKWAFKPGNPIANFLSCTRFGVLIIGSNLFLHAGLVQKFAKQYTPQQVNQIIRLWLQDKLLNPIDHEMILSSKDYSPFWNRIMGYLPTQLDKNDKQCSLPLQALQTWNVNHIHVGHTPQFSHNLGVNSTCSDAIWRHDIGMSHTFRKFDKNNISNNIHLLEIINDNTFNIIQK